MSDGQFVAPTIEELQPHFTQYAIESFVAVGGMGAVYRAKQVSVDRTVALKVLPPELAQDPEFRSRFAMEARAMAKLSHRNLVQLYDFGQDGEVVWMTQEWVDGRTVYELLEQEGAMDPREAAALVAQACEGLGYAHKQGVVHRDVKPGNMMEGEEGLLKLMDFGLARSIREGPEALQGAGRQRYATPEYAAPELWDANREVDHRVDIFALGVLLFETLTGRRPGAQFRNPSELRPGLDRRFDTIVIRALQRDPRNRFASCAEFLHALRDVVTTPAKVSTGRTTLMTGTASRVPAPRPTTGLATPAPQSRRGNSGVIGVAAAVLVVLGILAGGGWLWYAKQEEKTKRDNAALIKMQEDAALVERERQAEARRKRKADAAAREKRKADEAEAARKAEEERRRLAAMENQGDEEEKVEVKPAEDVLKKLQSLDAELRAAAGGTLATYEATLKDVKTRFLAACDAGEAEAAKAADLDAVLFWMKERAGVVRNNPGEGGDEAPDALVALRAEWQEKFVPLTGALEAMQSGYLEKCEALGAGDLPDETRDVLTTRWRAVSHFSGFLDLCAGTDPQVPGDVEIPPVVPVVPLPEKLRGPYEELQKTLVTLDAKGDRPRMQTMIKSFGRGLAAEEKRLTMELKIPEAVVVRDAKNDLLEKLQRLADGGSLDGNSTGVSVSVVRGGALTDDAEVSERSHWRRKGLVLESVGEDAWLRSRQALGNGDFVVRIRMALETIGSSLAMVRLGETEIQLDNQEGRVALLSGGAQPVGVEGKQIGLLIKAGEVFDVVLERKGPLLQVVINGKEALQTAVHEREIGALMVRGRETTVQLESIEMSGTTIGRIPTQRLVRHGHPSGSLGRPQLVGTGNEGLVCLFNTVGSGTSGLYAVRSRNGGGKWEKFEAILDSDDLGDQILASFGAAANPGRDVTWVAYTTGEANQRVFLTQGRSRGRNWSKSVEITEEAKEPGRYVWMAGRGIVLQKNERKRGRILMPMVEMGEGRVQTLYVIVSESGREWKRIGPVVGNVDRGAEMLEDSEGRIWLATGAKPGARSQFYRRWTVSEDGGDTWSEPKMSVLPDTGTSQGDLVQADLGRGRVAWYYVTTDGPAGIDLPAQTNLTLYGSKDRGKTWVPLRRFFYGQGKYPSIVPLGPDSCAIGFRKGTKQWGAQDVRVVVLKDLWKE